MSAKFVSRWVELARKQESNEGLIDALWHHALVLRNQTQWLKVIQTCDEILQIAPDPRARHETVRPEGLRDQASAELTNALDVAAPGFNWSWIFEPAVERGNWKLADVALKQMQQTPPTTRKENAPLELYRELLRAAKADDAVEVVRVVEQIKTRYGKISATLKRIRNKTLSPSEQSQHGLGDELPPNELR